MASTETDTRTALLSMIGGFHKRISNANRYLLAADVAFIIGVWTWKDIRSVLRDMVAAISRGPDISHYMYATPE